MLAVGTSRQPTGNLKKLYWRASHAGFIRQMNQFFARVVELLKEKYVKYDGNITMDSPSRKFLEMTNNLHVRQSPYLNKL